MSSGTAPARRVSWFHYEGNTSLLTANAAVLFRAAVVWAADLPSVPSGVVVVGNPSGLTSRDSWIRDRLEDAGWAVTLVDDNGITASAADGKQLVVVPESASGATVSDTFRATTTPVIVAESYILDDMGMVPVGSTNYGNTATDQTQVGVTTAGAVHPLGAGLPVGDATTSTVPMSHGWGKPAAGATVAATLPSDATKAVVFGYDSGAAMASGTAPARRVGWFHYSGAAGSLTDNATALFDAAVAWAGGPIDALT